MTRFIKKIFMDPEKIATPTARKILLSPEPGGQDKDFAFFSSLKLRNGVTKTTDRNRMTEVDKWFCGFLPKAKTQKILDVGISSGITTFELCQHLDAANFDYKLTGMDSDLTAFLVIFNDDTSVLVDKQANPIHFEINGKGFGYVRGTGLKHILERTALKLKSKFFFQFLFKVPLETVDKVVTANGTEIRRVQLVCRETKDNQSIKLIEDSIFSRDVEKEFNVIRAANILNRIYFSDDELTEAIINLRDRLEPGGFLLICRTDFEGQNNASLFSLGAEDKFELASRFGKGSEIEALVLNAQTSFKIAA